MLKKLPIIRHIRAVKLILAYTWRGVFIWGLRDVEQMEESQLFSADIDRAYRIWDGEE